MANNKKEIARLKREPYVRKLKKILGKSKAATFKLFKGISQAWDHFYYANFRLYKKYLTWLWRIVLFLLAVLVIMYFVKENKQYLDYMIIIGYISVGSIVFFRMYHMAYGKWIVYRCEHELTEKFITKKLPKIITFYGPTGVGKDTTGAGVAIMLSKFFKEKLTKEVNELVDSLFMFNLRMVDIHLDLRFLKYINPDEDMVESYFRSIFLDGKTEFVKKYYMDKYKYSLEAIWNDYMAFKSNKISYNSPFVYFDGLSRKHYVALLIKYCKKKVRLKYFPNYILSNQPFVEGKDLMAKMFSFDYTRTKSQDFKYKNKNGEKESWEEKVFWPWVEKVIVTETEVGTWYNNLDSVANQDIQKGGIRQFKAYNRHLLEEDYYHLQFDQTVNRTNKSIRELEHANSNIFMKNDIKGGAKRNFIIKMWMAGISMFRFNKKRVNKFNKKLAEKKPVEIPRLQRLYELTNEEKFLRRAKKLELKEYKDYAPRTERFIRKIARLKELMERNTNDGFIYVSMNISDGDTGATNIEPMPLKEILADERPLFKRSYSVRLCFRMRECYGHFDSHYLKAVAKERAGKSEMTFNDIGNWSKSMVMNKQDVITLGYKTAYSLFGLDIYDVNRLKYNITSMKDGDD